MTGMRTFAEQLRARLFACLQPILPITGPYALVDVPNHANVGDSAIYLGELAWLRAAGVPEPDYVSDVFSHDDDRLRARVPHGTILIHGGGNVGDLWRRHQALREQVIERFPHHRIIQLPQTIHFENPAALERAATLFSSHGNFTLLVRDGRSLELARDALKCPARSCPDAAFGLGPLVPGGPATAEVVALARTDKEMPGGGPPTGIPVFDWLEDDRTPLLRLERTLRSLGTGLWLRQRLRVAVAEQRVRRGCAALGRGRVVMTDRLHGHILCLLMGIPHVAVDNNYGKLRSFVEAWTAEAPGVRFCESWSEAGDALRSLRGEDTRRAAPHAGI